MRPSAIIPSAISARWSRVRSNRSDQRRRPL